MTMPQPHYLLFCNTGQNAQPNPELATRSVGRWHFVLEQLDGSERMEAADAEYSVNTDRLALLSVVRGLEALAQPSKVTLVTTSRYVTRGLRYGLETWREAEYQWERFGERKPIRNADLWRRVDGALSFHGVTCRLIESQNSETKHSTASQAAQVIQPVAEPCGALPTTAPHVAEVENERLVASGFQREDWMDKAESRIRDLEFQLARWQEQEAQLDVYQPVATGIERPASTSPRDSWWRLAAFWLKWWRGRIQPKHALMGT